MSQPGLDEVGARVAAYYGAKLQRHGANPRGVDWSCMATQWLRFVQLLKICRLDTPFSLIDFGCGYGALAGFMEERHPDACASYLGIDVSPAMVRRARRLHRGNPKVRFAVGQRAATQADYAVASGVMNVMLGFSVDIWEGFIETMLRDLCGMSRLGFAVNFLTGQSDDVLYRTQSSRWAAYCVDAFGRTVDVLDDYGMSEFTLLVRER